MSFMRTLLRRRTIPNHSCGVLPSCSTISTTCFRYNEKRHVSYVVEGELSDMHKELQKIEEIKERVKRMNEYYEQYIEEYYEVEETDDLNEEKISVKEPAPKPTTKFELVTFDEIYQVLQDHRAKNLIVIQLDQNQALHSHMIICSPHNYRHSEALADRLRGHIKQNFELSIKDMQFVRRIKQTKGWYVLDLPGTIVHVMSSEIRERYDLESLWGIGDIEEGDPNKSFLSRLNEEYKKSIALI